MVIELRKILENRSYPDAGAELLNNIECHINEEKIIIDMEEVSAIPSMFMNMSFAVLMEKYGVEKVKKIISFKNITKGQVDRIRKYFSDYEELLKNNRSEITI